MKVYFVASLAGKGEYGENYQRIYEALENLDCDVISNHVLSTDSKELEQVSSEDEKKFYSQLKKWIKQADIFVAEVSYRSTNVGHEISLAINQKKPVILLHVKGKKPKLFEGIDAPNVQLIPYDIDIVEEELKFALEYAQDQQDTRFNFFISPKHQNYLDWISREMKVPRSVFLRRLIDEHMENNEDYP